MIQVAIAEDDYQCFTQLKYINRLGQETDRSFHITYYDNGEDLIEHYKPEFDLLLLDIEMPFIDGIAAASYIRVGQKVVIIFVTILAQYVIQGYLVNAADYILKLVSYFVL